MKRFIDVSIALLVLVALSPILVVVAILVRWHFGSPVIFRQQRAGLHGRPFRLIKFRTMLDDPDVSGGAREDEARLTPFGRMLRASSLDELPELWNVLRGDMSLVGPRPLLLDYLPLYSPEQMRRHEIRPGITGWAQVNGRNSQSWEDRFKLDVWYVDNRSFWLDVKILMLTVLKVLRREGINAAGQATMVRFTGSDGS